MSIRRHLLTFSWILLGSLCNLGPRQSCITFSQSHQFYSSKRLGLFFWDVPFVIFGSSKSSLLFMPRLIFLLRWYFYVCAEQILSPYIWFASLILFIWMLLICIYLEHVLVLLLPRVFFSASFLSWVSYLQGQGSFFFLVKKCRSAGIWWWSTRKTFLEFSKTSPKTPNLHTNGSYCSTYSFWNYICNLPSSLLAYTTRFFLSIIPIINRTCRDYF